MKPKISFLVTTHNETSEFDILLEQLTKHIETNPEDEIIVVDDYSDNPLTVKILEAYGKYIKLHQRKLDTTSDGFGGQKNFGNSKCSGDFIMQLDADEYLSDDLLGSIKDLIEMNPSVDLYAIPRVNILQGITQKSLDRWGWRVMRIKGIGGMHSYKKYGEEFEFLQKNGFLIRYEGIGDNLSLVTHDYAIINFPDFQSRLYKNSNSIRWTRPLHEYIVGSVNPKELPQDPNWSIIHHKSLERQEKQNIFYNENFSKELNSR